jgi:hypothetical protein
VQLNLRELLSNNDYKENKVIQRESNPTSFNEGFLEKCKQDGSNYYKWAGHFTDYLSSAIESEDYDKIKEIIQMDEENNPRYLGKITGEIKNDRMYNFIKSLGYEFHGSVFKQMFEFVNKNPSEHKLLEILPLEDFVEGFRGLMSYTTLSGIPKPLREIIEKRINEYENIKKDDFNQISEHEMFKFKLGAFRGAIQSEDYAYLKELKFKNELDFDQSIVVIPDEHMFEFLKDLGFDMFHMDLHLGFGRNQLQLLEQAIGSLDLELLKKRLDDGYRSFNYGISYALGSITMEQLLLMSKYPDQIVLSHKSQGWYDLLNKFRNALKKSNDYTENNSNLEFVKKLMSGEYLQIKDFLREAVQPDILMKNITRKIKRKIP